jgi:phasin family protein
MCEEWGEIVRALMELGFDRMYALMQSRTPQDAAAVQSEMLRDNLETFLGFARKVAEHSNRLADEAKRRSRQGT